MPASRGDLRHASTIAVVVHGVGDHTSTDVLAEARAGFDAMQLAGQVSAISIADFLTPEGRRETQPALAIHVGEETHVVIPVIWSRLRLRAAYSTRGEMPRTALNPVDLVADGLFPLLVAWVDALRCIPRAGTLGWKAAIVAADLAMLMLIAGLASGVLYTASHLPFWLGTAGAAPRFGWISPLLLVLALAALVYLVRLALPTLDFVGDVVAYIGRPDRRRETEALMAEIINEAARRAPRARILVVGHSLGSVLVSHSLVTLNAQGPAAGRTFLMTLGSPLRLMSRVFPAHVATPDALLLSYANTGAVDFWVNVWRDRDFIGQALKPAPQGSFAERSLGDGVHWGMWSDRRTWEAVHDLLKASGADSLSALTAAWGDDTLSDGQKAEGLRLLQYLGLVRGTIAPFGLLFCAYLVGWGPDPWFASSPPAVSAALLALNLTIALALTAAMVRSVTAVQVGTRSARELHAAVRSGARFCRTCVLIAGGGGFACGLLLFLSRTP